MTWASSANGNGHDHAVDIISVELNFKGSPPPKSLTKGIKSKGAFCGHPCQKRASSHMHELTVAVVIDVQTYD
jgi:hypothetical protein